MPAANPEIDQRELERRAHADLAKRARGGIFIYLVAWLILTVPTNVHASEPVFFYTNTVILIVIMLSRLGHFLTDRFRPTMPVPLRRTWLVATILAGALHWGLMCFWILTHDGFKHIEFYLIASAAVLGIAGTAALSIAREIRILFPLFMLMPTTIAYLYRQDSDDWILASMVVLALVYVIGTARTTGRDYWQSIENQMLAERRAVEMEKLSVTDQLTGLKNRSFFDQRFAEEWSRACRQASTISLLMVDLDYFKRLNDTHGHVFGDLCLQQVAAVLQREVKREIDLVARYGGEEFVVLLPDTDAAGALRVGEILRHAIESIEIDHQGQAVRLSASIGGASGKPQRADKAASLLKRADEALYQAKAAGRNRYHADSEAAMAKIGTG